mmetsp:Transcript_16231/g.50375  ORF Transcript_16231/g.50375 Transcript_16231/m.50375 type:complete len:451 (-) Transcript_16231:341-1693(-)|eukprot:CAMPEP_0174877790 /NCGR_PEP_ID=MMETSP1114-20130205/82434_1 /TAXON_ID=312471 /ORGANISM="Neobodo designis, Strain CCAP 1951/1" /LENGTH=450 /DNA_ID=CAMNT_0016113177 /DNA_START=213 /DNA_END=1565 /DNA_ORIENTATION=-
MTTQMDQHQLNIERFKVKKLIKSLEVARGAGTSVITLYIPPKDQIAKHVQMLNAEFGTCSNIKSHTNRLSVQSAITSTLGRLKLISRVPSNGLIIYCGTVLTEDNKEKKITLDIEPFKPVSRSLYMCDNKFHTDELHRMLESDERFGFIIVDGNGCYYFAVAGDVKEKLGSFTVELPKKHGRGGQSKNRFARIRQERRHNYLRKVAEGATQYFITNDRPNVLGLVLAGSAEFKESLYLSDMFDPRLKEIVVKLVDIAHSGEVGLNQAIDLASDSLGNVKLIQEKKLLQKFYDELALDTNMYCYGVGDTMKAIDMGAVHTLIAFEDLETLRVTVKPADGSPASYYYYTPKEMEKPEVQKILHATNVEGGAANEIETVNLIEFLTENYQKMGFTLELVTDKSQEGTQFVRGFGGMGGLLRYKVDMMQLNEMEKQGEEEDAGGSDFDIDDDFM